MGSRKWRFVSGVLAVVLVALLMAGAAEAQAAQALHVANWTGLSSVLAGVRPTVLYDSSDNLYKMWYKTDESASYISYATSDGITWGASTDTDVAGALLNNLPTPAFGLMIPPTSPRPSTLRSGES